MSLLEMTLKKKVHFNLDCNKVFYYSVNSHVSPKRTIWCHKFFKKACGIFCLKYPILKKKN
jgi:hypothetical protein